MARSKEDNMQSKKQQSKLELLQNNILLILKEIDRICEENNISYFLDGGTALGAIRHKGFIPWDDDADVGMLRDQYERFKKCCMSGKLGSRFFFQDYDTEDKYCDGFARIRLNDTLCVVDYHKERGYKHLGIFVDIFPFDYVNTNNIKQLKSRHKKIMFWNKLLMNKVSESKSLKTSKSKIVHFFLNFFSKKYIIKQRSKKEKMLGDKNSQFCVSTYTSYSIPKKLFKVTDVQKTKTVPFCNIALKVVENYDLFLTQIYGDYLKLPPKEKQIAHLPSIIEVNYEK